MTWCQHVKERAHGFVQSEHRYGSLQVDRTNTENNEPSTSGASIIVYFRPTGKNVALPTPRSAPPHIIGFSFSLPPFPRYSFQTRGCHSPKKITIRQPPCSFIDTIRMPVSTASHRTTSTAFMHLHLSMPPRFSSHRVRCDLAKKISETWTTEAST